jgi:4'-phosphopantetheinyl transferase
MTFEQKTIRLTHSIIHFISYDNFDPDSYLHVLTQEEQERYFGFTNLFRKKEFIATRYLRHQLFGFEHIHYDSNGAPYIHNEGYISISHTPGIVGIALNNEFRIGLDIETRSEKAKRVYKKFLSENEQKLFNVMDPDTMTIAWSAKETLYKIAGRKRIDFKLELSLLPKESGVLIGEIDFKGIYSTTEIHTFVEESYVFCINESALSPEI